MPQTPVRVMMWPVQSGANPYAAMVVDALRSNGAIVEKAGGRALFRRWTAFHMHWPDWTIRDRGFFVGLIRVVALSTLLALQRLLGTKIVWTVHNLSPHGTSNPHLERFLYGMLASLVDVQIHLSSATEMEMRATGHRCANREHVVIPIGTYGITDAHWPEELASVPDGEPLVTLLGAIHPYKGIPDLIRCVAEAPATSPIRCIVAGLPEDTAHVRTVHEMARSTARVSVLARLLSDEEYEALVQRSTLFVVPFTSVLNSSSVIKALSTRVPVLVPKSPSFDELQLEVGPDWVMTYTGALTVEILTAAVDRASHALSSAGAPDLSQRDWGKIGRDHINAYGNGPAV